MANGKRYCNSSPLCYLNPCLFYDYSVEGYSFLTDQWMSFERQENVSNCDAVNFRLKCNTRLLMGRAPESLHWAEAAFCQSRHYCNLLNKPSSAFLNFPFLVKLAALCYCGPTEQVPILLRAIAPRDSTCAESTLLNALRKDCIF